MLESELEQLQETYCLDVIIISDIRLGVEAK